MPPKALKVETLHHHTTAELVQAWTELVGKAPRYAGSRELLLLGLAWHLQVHQQGGLSARFRRHLKTLRKAAPSSDKGHHPTATARFQPGTVLTKEWRGKCYTVMVQQQGFAFAGQTYQSLSEVARVITGSRWNGPAFFGLRKGNRKDKRNDNGDDT